MSTGRDYLGPYRLVRLLRTSQTCQILEAIRDSDGIRVVLKALNRRNAGNRAEIGLLKHEFSVGCNLHHPCVIETYAYHDQYEVPFLAMESFNALNLKQALRQAHEALFTSPEGIIRQAAEGLHYFHGAGYLHRDVKPDNFLLSDEGGLKLIDFSIAQKQVKGLAKLFAGKSKIAGTRSYMAPEQIRGKEVDARADIYSYGCMVYELLCGKPPYSAVNPDDLLNKHLKSPIPSIVSANDNVTPEMAALVTRLLAKKREDRPASLGEVLEELAKIRPYKHPPRRPTAEEV